MNVSSEDIERKLREESANLPTAILLERAELCILSDNPQPVYGRVFYSILTERDPTNEVPHIGLAQCLMHLGKLEEADKEVTAAKELIARLCPKDSRETLDNFLYAHFLQDAINVRRAKKASEFRLKVLEGLRLRNTGNHNKAQMFFMNAVKYGNPNEKEEAIFYATTLYKLPAELIEANLRKSNKPPAFFWNLPMHEREYLLEVRRHIQNYYLPCGTAEEIRRSFGRKAPAPIDRDDLMSFKIALKQVNTLEDLGM